MLVDTVHEASQHAMATFHTVEYEEKYSQQPAAHDGKDAQEVSQPAGQTRKQSDSSLLNGRLICATKVNNYQAFNFNILR